MSSFMLHLEVFAGSGIEDACEEAIAIANKLGVVVMFRFNDIKCMARPGDGPSTLASDWDRLMKDGKAVYAIAVGQPLLRVVKP